MRTCRPPSSGGYQPPGRRLSAAAVVVVEKGLCREISKFFRRFYPRCLLHWTGKCGVVVLFAVYMALSSFGVANVEESFRLESFIPPESYYTKHLQVSFMQ